MTKTIAVIGAFDTKAEEHQFVIERIHERGHQVLSLNIGIMGTSDLFPVDIESGVIAEAGGESIVALRNMQDRGYAMKIMSQGAPKVVLQLYEQGKIHGIIGMGGTGGTSVITAAMRQLPLGVPKVCVSTAASGNTEPYIGTKDIVLIPSIVDVAGLNRISQLIFTRAAGAICGMVEAEEPAQIEDRPIITASMFGNTTECVGMCQEILSHQGYEVLVFHAVGSGGRTMEDLIKEGFVKGVLDITTTEWADELCGGIFGAGPTRLTAAGPMGIPHLIVPGCIDMVNFGGKDTIPAVYQNRQLYEWNPNVTLMRTTPEENAQLGEIFAQVANAAKGAVGFLIPTLGYSILDSIDKEGKPQLFWNPEADQAFIDSLRLHLNANIFVEEMAVNINDPAFAERATSILRNWIEVGQ